MMNLTTQSADGTAIAYDRYGGGPLVVLVGGAFQTRGGDPRTAALAEQLAGHGFSVVHYDRRGRGDSGDTAPYATEREVEDLAALAGDGAHVYAMSSGGYIALDAAKAGVPVTSIALYEIPVLTDGSRPPVPRDYLARMQASIAAGDRDAAAAQFLTEAVMVPAEVVGGMRRAPFWEGMTSVAHTLPYDGAFTEGLMFGDPDAPARRWGDVATPVHVITGGKSHPWFAAGADALAQALPNATRATIPDQDHDVDAAALVPVLAAFLHRRSEA